MPKRKRTGSQWVFSVCALFLVSICPRALAADFVLHLKNGDRLTGAITSETAAEVVFKTRLGTVKIPPGEISKREPVPETAAPAEDPLITSNTVKSAAPPAAPATNVVSAPAPAAPAVKPPAPKHWNLDLQFGLNLRYSTREQQEMLAIGKYTYGKEKLRETLDYNFTYGRTEGIRSANRMSGASKTEYDLSPQVYLFGLGGAGYDEVRRIDLQWEVSPGVGYQWVKKTDYVFKTEFGLSYQEQYFATGDELDIYGGRLAAIFTWRIWDKLVADGRGEIFPSFSDFGEYRVRLESTLKYPLRKNVSLNLIVIDLYDTNPAPGVENNDLQIRSAIGVKF